MANASAKRIASQNETALRNLSYLMVLIPFLSLLIRFLFRNGSIIPPSKTSIVLHISTFIPILILYRQLNFIGSPRRDALTGALISAGEDLNMPGVIEWTWDVIYVTWVCQIGTALLGEWFWWFYLSIPAYAIYRIYTSFIGPMFSGSGPSSASPAINGQKELEGTSKRQQKLKKRSEKGDPRVRVVQ